MVSNIKLCAIVLSGFLVASVLSTHHRNDGIKTKTFHRDPQMSEALYESSKKYYQQSDNDRSNFDNFQAENPNLFVTENALVQYFTDCPPGQTGQFPYMYDCRRFLNCWKGRGQIQVCGPGTVFNPNTLECDSPDKVVCSGFGTIPNKNSETTSTSRSGRLQSKEPKCDPTLGSVQPHPTNCKQFLNCANGIMHIQDCGPGTAFSQTMLVCDFENKVDCSQNRASQSASGYGSQSGGSEYTVSGGYGSQSGGASSVGYGSQSGSASSGGYYSQSGSASLGGGYGSQSRGSESTTVSGGYVSQIGGSATSGGYGSQNTGYGSHGASSSGGRGHVTYSSASGGYDSQSSGSSVTGGYNSQSSGSRGTAGLGSQNSGSSVTGGYNSQSSGSRGTAGYGSQSSGSSGGYGSQSSGSSGGYGSQNSDSSVSGGYGSQSIGTSVSGGYGSQGSGTSVSGGYGTQSSSGGYGSQSSDSSSGYDSHSRGSSVSGGYGTQSSGSSRGYDSQSRDSSVSGGYGSHSSDFSRGYGTQSGGIELTTVNGYETNVAPNPPSNRGSKTFSGTISTNALESGNDKFNVHEHYHHTHHPHHRHHQHHTHEFHSQPPPTGTATTQSGYQDRWTQMNMQRPSAPGGYNPSPNRGNEIVRGDDSQKRVDTAWDSSSVSTDNVQEYTSVNKVKPTQTHHVIEGNVHYIPNSNNSVPRTTTTTTNVFYAQPLGEDEDSEETFNTPTRTTTIYVTKRPIVLTDNTQTLDFPDQDRQIKVTETSFDGYLAPPPQFTPTTQEYPYGGNSRVVQRPIVPTHPMNAHTTTTMPPLVVSVPPIELMPPFKTAGSLNDGQTNVRVFQVYPTIENETVQIFPDPHISRSYSGVAHSRDSTWAYSSPVPIDPTIVKTKTHVESQSPPSESEKPAVVYSRDGGVIVNPIESDYSQISPVYANPPRHHKSIHPHDYNKNYYKQTTSTTTSVSPNAEGDSAEATSTLPISEALRLLLKPYINRSGTVSESEAKSADSHIMSMLAPKDPKIDTKKLEQDSEIIFTDEQAHLNEDHNLSPPPSHQNHHHIHHQDSNSNTRPNWLSNPSGHTKGFHESHPHLPNPYNPRREPTTIAPLVGPTYPQDIETSASSNVISALRFGVVEQEATPRIVLQPAARKDTRDQVCEFDCGNGICLKKHQVCDGINQCENRKDEEKCDHLGFEVRLAGDEGGKHMGRIEVKILGKWGLVCDDKFNMTDAHVLCKELGYPMGASEIRPHSYYPATNEMKYDNGEVRFFMDEIDCSGVESSIKDCDFKGWGVHKCSSDEVLGVVCKIPTAMKCANDYWLCKTSKECIPPAFLCDNVPDCADKSDEISDYCNSPVEYRLANGDDKTQGRVEVRYSGAWGTVCDDDFGEREARVVCKSLGFDGPAKLLRNKFGAGTGPIWLDQVSCFGNETSIDKCIHWTWGEHNCNHSEDISIRCSNKNDSTFLNRYQGTSQSPQISTEEMDSYLYQMGRSSKFLDQRKKCGSFNPNVTDPYEHEEDEMTRVIKGNTAKRGHHPWQATIRTKGRDGKSSHWCGAVLISKKHLLTAAHCLGGYGKGAYFIRMGDHYSNIAESSEVDVFIENWFIHEDFRKINHLNNDIALIVLKSAVRFNDYVQPICLPHKGANYNEGKMCKISGWGSNKSGISTPSNNLRVAEIPIISDETCRQPIVYGDSITDGMFCAGYLDERVDACDGDSGGPLVCTDDGAETLYGIISWGLHCGYENKPGVYVKIDQYVDWIYDKIKTSMQSSN